MLDLTRLRWQLEAVTTPLSGVIRWRIGADDVTRGERV
jgi:hypothetical protein